MKKFTYLPGFLWFLFLNSFLAYVSLASPSSLLYTYEENDEQRIALRRLDGTIGTLPAAHFPADQLPKNLPKKPSESKESQEPKNPETKPIMSLKTTIPCSGDPRLTLYQGKGFIRDFDKSVVSIFSLKPNTEHQYSFLATNIKVGQGPRDVLLSPEKASHHYYVTLNATDSSISFIDADKDSLIKTIFLAGDKRAPWWSRLQGDWLEEGKYLYVLVPVINQTIFLDVENLSILQTVSVGESPITSLVEPQGKKLYVVNYGDPFAIPPSLSVLDISDPKEGAPVVASWVTNPPNSTYLSRWPYYIFPTHLSEKGWLSNSSKSAIVVRDSLTVQAAYFETGTPNFIKMGTCNLPADPPSLITIGKTTYEIKVGDLGVSINLLTHPGCKLAQCLYEGQVNWFAVSGNTLFVPLPDSEGILVYGPA